MKESENLVVKRSTPLGGKTWLNILLFGFMGQLAWAMENMYYSTYIQKNITADSWATSLTVAFSAIAAAVSTILTAAWTDRVGKRRAFVSWGYILWGIVCGAFALFGSKHVAAAGVIGAVILFVIMDCVMSAIGSMANDAAFSAWITDVTDVTNRGFVDTILSLMPLIALMVILAAFSPLAAPVEEGGNWALFFLIIGGLTFAAGLIGLFTFRDSKKLKPTTGEGYLREVLYAFRPKNIKANKMIYICFLGMMFSSLAMQLWQPYMINLIQVTLGIDNYIVPVAIVIVSASLLSVLAGKLMDHFGKEKFYYPVAAIQVIGGLMVYSSKFIGNEFLLLAVGGSLIMAGNLTMAGLFTASSRDYTPEGRAGASQSVKMIIYVMLPMVLASLICPLIINGVALEPTAEVLAKYPEFEGSYLYPHELYLAAAVAALFIFIPAFIVKRDANRIRKEKLEEVKRDAEEVLNK